jgi:4-amino-4-deoxy-L-arabinose transferase-like glycosyltransferase
MDSRGQSAEQVVRRLEPAPEPTTATGRFHERSAPPRTVWIVALLLALALVLRLGYVAATPGYQAIDDAHNYDVHALSIAAGHGFARIGSGPSGETAFRPPGYPYLLAGVYALTGVERATTSTRLLAGRVANALVGTVIVALIGVLSAQLFDRRVALVAMALGAVYLPLILVGGSLMSEPLFAALMLGALAAAVQHRRSAHRCRWALLAGVLGGLAILTRANAAILLVPLVVAVWDARPRWSWRTPAPPAALVAVALGTVAAWTIRNAVVFDTFVPVSTQLGTALAGTYNDAARTDREHPASWRSLRRVPDYQYLVRRWHQIPEPVLERKLRAAALRYAAHHPAYIGEVAFWNTVRALDLAGISWSRHTASTISIGPRWADAGVVTFWPFAALAIAGALTARGRRTPPYVAAVPALLFLSVAFLAFETPRYRTGIDPFIVMLASVALFAGWGRQRRAQAPCTLRSRRTAAQRGRSRWPQRALTRLSAGGCVAAQPERLGDASCPDRHAPRGSPAAPDRPAAGAPTSRAALPGRRRAPRGRSRCVLAAPPTARPTSPQRACAGSRAGHSPAGAGAAPSPTVLADPRRSADWRRPRGSPSAGAG